MSTSQIVGSQVVGHIPVTQRYGYGRLREYDREAVRQRISWRALIAGLVIVIAVQLLLATLGAGIGLSIIHHQSSNTPDATSFSMGAGLWWLVSTLIALAIGRGYLTARLASSVPIRWVATRAGFMGLSDTGRGVSSHNRHWRCARRRL